MMKRMAAGWMAVLILCWAPLAQAQRIDRDSPLRDGRKARIDARENRGTWQLLRSAPTPDDNKEEKTEETKAEELPANASITLGLAFDRDEAGTRTHSTPISFSYQTAGERWWKFKVEGDGHVRSRERNADAIDGVSDVLLRVQHALGSGFIAGVGLSLPSKDEHGSMTVSQSAKLIYARSFGSTKWGTYLSGSLSHENGTPKDQSPYTKVMYGELSYGWTDRHVLLANATYVRHSGTGSTDMGFEYDFPISRSGRLNTVDGALSLVRGITNGARHTTVELGVTWRF